MRVIDQEAYDAWKAKNDDSYGACTFRYLERWADLMEKRMNNWEKLEDIADGTSHEADTEGITGFMYGCAVQILCECWVFGKDLRNWHNKKYNYEGDNAVNPAIITINTKE